MITLTKLQLVAKVTALTSLFVGSQAFAGWSINGTEVLDPKGNAFVFRGINHAHSWYPDKTAQSLTDIAATGANAARIVLSDGDQWTRNAGADVANVIAECKTAKLVCVLEVHDSTGFGDSAAATNIAKAASYWASADVKNALIGQEDYVVINIANEPYGNKVTAATYVSETSAAIKTLRNAGLTHLLMVDAPNWGQDSSFIMRDNAATIFAADSQSNTLFSVHMYENYNNPTVIEQYLSSFKAKGYPLVVGEFGSENNGKPVDVASILKYTQQLGIGYFGWSWGGNGSCCTALNITNNWDATSLSTWGNQFINGQIGIKATSQQSTIFSGASSNSSASSQPPTSQPDAAQTDMNTLYSRIETKIFSQSFSANSVDNRLKIFNATTGRFDDPRIDYSVHVKGKTGGATDYAPYQHIQYTKELVLAYVKSADPKSPYYKTYHTANMLNIIKKAMDVNLEYSHIDYFEWAFDFYKIFIRSPQDIAECIFLLKDSLTPAEYKKYAGHLRDGLQFPGLVNATGNAANRVWIARDTVLQGLLLNDIKMVNEGLASISGIAAIVSSDDRRNGMGIKPDYQWHEHEGQFYTGGYGGAIFDIIEFLDFTKGTAFFSTYFPKAKTDLLATTLLEGYQWVLYKQRFDYQTLGRQYAASNKNKGVSIADFQRIVDHVPAKKPAFDKWLNNLNSGASGVTGNRYFWRSNVAVQRGDNYYLSARVPSTRWAITESFSNLNVKGFTVGLGATTILTSSEEYDDIYPLWDWSRVPGTTVRSNYIIPFTGQYPYGANDFSGGVSSGNNGIIAFNGTYNKISANKAYFFIDDALYAMGSGIATPDNVDVTTSVNQTRTNGTITLSKAGAVQTYNQGTSIYTDLQWAHQDSVGYLFPKGGKITLENINKKGYWKDIHSDDGDPKEIKKDVFSLWFDHGNQPVNGNYEYVVVPDKNAAEFANYAAANPFVSVINNTQVQAIKNTAKGIYAAVFYAAGRVDMKDDLIISVDKAAMVLIEKNASGYQISVSDPLYKTSNSITLSINKKLSGDNTVYDSATNTTQILLTMPVGDNQGRSVSKVYNLVGVPSSSSSKSSVASSKPKSSTPASVASSTPKSSAPASVVSSTPKSSAPASVVSSTPKNSAPASVVSSTPKSSAPASVASSTPKSSTPSSVASSTPKSSTPSSVASSTPKSSRPSSVASSTPKSSTPASVVSSTPKSSTPASVVSSTPTSSVPASVASSTPKSSAQSSVACGGIAGSTNSAAACSMASKSSMPKSSAPSSVSSSTPSSKSASSMSSSSASVSPLSCVYNVTGSWDWGFTSVIRITNTGKTRVADWKATWNYQSKNRITNVWNANLVGDNPYSASIVPNSSLEWNRAIEPGQTIEFGFQADKNGDVIEQPTVNCF